jgi:hypothetical protein
MSIREFRFRLRNPLDVLCSVPYLLGYHPEHSVVLIGLQGWDLHLVARSDLPTGPDGLDALIRRMDGFLEQSPVDRAILVAYGAAEPCQATMPALLSTVERHGLALFEALRADDGRYWSYLCQNPHCCPAEGTPYDIQASEVAAEATLAGLPILPDRHAYERQVEPLDDETRAGMPAATGRAQDRLHRLIASAQAPTDLAAVLRGEGAAAIAAGVRTYRAGQRLDDDSVAWLSVLVEWTEVHELALRRLTEEHDLLEQRALWLDILRRVEPDLAPGPGVLFAIAAWRRGELVLAQHAVTRVLGLVPGFGLALMLDAALSHGLPPHLALPYLSTMDRQAESPVRPRRGRRPRRRSSSRRAGSQSA